MTEPFIPAARLHALTPFYEPFCRVFIGHVWRRIAREAARRTPHAGRVVELGCGPGAVLRLLRRARPDLELVGTDIDPGILRIARQKSADSRIVFHEASAESLPLPERSADAVVSSMMFHHLPSPTKAAAVREVERVLKPGGVFLLCDFSAPARRCWTPLELWKHIEPEILPQLDGQLLRLGEEAGARGETVATFYGVIALHAFTFPAPIR